jgi:hypothetical protein
MELVVLLKIIFFRFVLTPFTWRFPPKSPSSLNQLQHTHNVSRVTSYTSLIVNTEKFSAFFHSLRTFFGDLLNYCRSEIKSKTTFTRGAFSIFLRILSNRREEMKIG